MRAVCRSCPWRAVLVRLEPEVTTRIVAPSARGCLARSMSLLGGNARGDWHRALSEPEANISAPQASRFVVPAQPRQHVPRHPSP